MGLLISHLFKILNHFSQPRTPAMMRVMRKLTQFAAFWTTALLLGFAGCVALPPVDPIADAAFSNRFSACLKARSAG